WIRLANYVHVLRDTEFREIVLPNTFGFMAASVACSLLLGLAIALMLNRHFPGRWLVQSFVLLPLMVAPVIAAIMIRWMFNDQFGVVNAALEGLGIAHLSWLTQRWTTFSVILLTDVWLWTPWFALILLAGLQSLPPDPVAPAQSAGFFSALAPRGKAAFFALAAIAVCLLFAFPVFWLILTSLRPGTGVYYVHRGTEFTIDNFHEVLSQEIVLRALFNSFM